MKSINLETILDQFDKHKTISEAQKSDILPAMMEACRQVLELASYNTVIKLHQYDYDEVDLKSILNTINQIEIYEIN